MDERFKIVPQEVRVKEIFAENKAYLENDHFVYTKGDHGSQYINKDAIFTNPSAISELSRFLARSFQGLNIETVAGPVIGGVIVSQRVAEHLSEMDNKKVVSVFAEKTGKGLEFLRGYNEHIEGKNVLAVEDILNTGGSAKDLIDAIRLVGGNVIGLGALANRGGVKPNMVGDVNIKSLLDITMERYAANECHLCKEGVPINLKVGHGRKFEK